MTPAPAEPDAARRLRLIAITEAELAALYGAGPLAVAMYIELRRQMDYHDGTVGKSTPISLHGLARACETHITRGKGFEIRQPSEKEIRTALDRLTRAAGLTRRLPGDPARLPAPAGADRPRSRRAVPGRVRAPIHPHNRAPRTPRRHLRCRPNRARRPRPRPSRTRHILMSMRIKTPAQHYRALWITRLAALDAQIGLQQDQRGRQRRGRSAATARTTGCC